MSKFVESFRNHPVHSSLDQLETAAQKLGNTDSNIAESLRQAASDSENRAKLITNFTRSRLERADPVITPRHLLNNLKKQIDAANQRVNSFKARPLQNELNNFDNNCDQIAQQARLLPVVENLEDIEIINDAIVSVRRSAGQHRRNIRDNYLELQQKVAELANRSEETGQEIKDQKKRLDTALQNYEKQYSEASEERRKSFSELVGSLQERTTDTEKKLNNDVLLLQKVGVRKVVKVDSFAPFVQ